jgi:cytochrome c2
MAMKKGIFAFSCLGLLLAVRLPVTAAGDAKKGEMVFENCAVCHNSDSTEVKIGPGLKGLFKREKLVTGKPVNEKNVMDLIDSGSNAMPPFADALSKEEKENVIAYLMTL